MAALTPAGCAEGAGSGISVAAVCTLVGPWAEVELAALARALRDLFVLCGVAASGPNAATRGSCIEPSAAWLPPPWRDALPGRPASALATMTTSPAAPAAPHRRCSTSRFFASADCARAAGGSAGTACSSALPPSFWAIWCRACPTTSSSPQSAESAIMRCTHAYGDARRRLRWRLSCRHRARNPELASAASERGYPIPGGSSAGQAHAESGTIREAT